VEPSVAAEFVANLVQAVQWAAYGKATRGDAEDDGEGGLSAEAAVLVPEVYRAFAVWSRTRRRLEGSGGGGGGVASMSANQSPATVVHVPRGGRHGSHYRGHDGAVSDSALSDTDVLHKRYTGLRRGVGAADGLGGVGARGGGGVGDDATASGSPPPLPDIAESAAERRGGGGSKAKAAPKAAPAPAPAPAPARREGGGATASSPALVAALAPEAARAAAAATGAANPAAVRSAARPAGAGTKAGGGSARMEATTAAASPPGLALPVRDGGDAVAPPESLLPVAAAADGRPAREAREPCTPPALRPGGRGAPGSDWSGDSGEEGGRSVLGLAAGLRPGLGGAPGVPGSGAIPRRRNGEARSDLFHLAVGVPAAPAPGGTGAASGIPYVPPPTAIAVPTSVESLMMVAVATTLPPAVRDALGTIQNLLLEDPDSEAALSDDAGWLPRRADASSGDDDSGDGDRSRD